MSQSSHFIGRKEALSKLSTLKGLSGPKLVVLKGRRRIGKSRLLEEFGRQFKKLAIFSGLAPAAGIRAQEQRREFALQLERHFGIRGIKSDDWSDLFWHLTESCRSGETLIVLDEITWMAQGDPTFLPKLKNAWDLNFKKNPKLILALCGSISGWIENNLIHSTGFLGRISLSMTLEELSLKESLKFWEHRGKGILTQDKLTILSITGGVPRYLEEIDPKQSAQQNMGRLCFDRDGILFNEFDQIFSDLFSKRSGMYKKIAVLLSEGPKEAADIAKRLKLSQSGELYEYLQELTLAGFVSRDYSWHFQGGKLSKLSHFRLKDNYSRFYLKYILPNREKIALHSMASAQPSVLPNWSTVVGLQLENLVLHNRDLIRGALGLSAEMVVADNPYFQRKTTKQEGCQIDYLIQTKYNTLFVCEVKYSKNEIKLEVIEEMKRKLGRLVKPKNFSTVPVLIHFGEVQEAVIESQFFAKIIDFSDFLTD